MLRRDSDKRDSQLVMLKPSCFKTRKVVQLWRKRQGTSQITLPVKPPPRAQLPSPRYPPSHHITGNLFQRMQFGCVLTINGRRLESRLGIASDSGWKPNRSYRKPISSVLRLNAAGEYRRPSMLSFVSVQPKSHGNVRFVTNTLPRSSTGNSENETITDELSRAV